jgi:CheY-like chemotaxis protein
LSGLQLRQHLLADKNTRYRSVPFLLWSTAASEKEIKEAYDAPTQGIFLKPFSFKDLKKTLSTLIEYWKINLHPKEK